MKNNNKHIVFNKNKFIENTTKIKITTDKTKDL